MLAIVTVISVAVAAPAMASTVTVPGTAGPTGPGGAYGQWGGTGIIDSGVVAAGSVVMTAAGTINATTNPTFGQNIGPAGSANDTCDSGCLAAGLPAWGLVVKIGDGPWQQGAAGPVTLTGTGPVYLAVNDGWYGDNSGAFSVTLTLPTSTVTAQLEALQADVAGVGPGSSLADKVAAAEAAYDSGDVVQACGALRDFMNQVRALSGKKMPVATAQALLADAEAVAAAIPC